MYAAADVAKSLQSCPTLCDPIDSSPPGSPVPGILQVRTLEWVAISFSNAWKWKVRVKSLSRVQPLAWTAAYQAPPSMGFSRQEYWSGVPLPSLNWYWGGGKRNKLHKESKLKMNLGILNETFKYRVHYVRKKIYLWFQSKMLADARLWFLKVRD